MGRTGRRPYFRSGKTPRHRFTPFRFSWRGLLLRDGAWGHTHGDTGAFVASPAVRLRGRTRRHRSGSRSGSAPPDPRLRADPGEARDYALGGPSRNEGSPLGFPAYHARQGRALRASTPAVRAGARPAFAWAC